MSRVADLDLPQLATSHLDLAHQSLLVEQASNAHRDAAWALIVEAARSHEDHAGTLSGFSRARLIDLGDSFIALELDAAQLDAGLDQPHHVALLEDVLAAAAGRPVEVLVANERAVML